VEEDLFHRTRPAAMDRRGLLRTRAFRNGASVQSDSSMSTFNGNGSAMSSLRDDPIGSFAAPIGR